MPSFFGENYTREALNTEKKKKKKKKRERIYEGETPNPGNQKLVCLQFSGWSYEKTVMCFCVGPTQ